MLRNEPVKYLIGNLEQFLRTYLPPRLVLWHSSLSLSPPRDRLCCPLCALRSAKGPHLTATPARLAFACLLVSAVCHTTFNEHCFLAKQNPYSGSLRRALRGLVGHPRHRNCTFLLANISEFDWDLPLQCGAIAH